MDFNQILLVAFLVESLIQTFKPIYDKEKGWNKDAIIALVVGVGLCFLLNINLFYTFNIPINIGNDIASYYSGIVLTGIIASRGSNLAHDILKFVQNASVSNSINAVG
jgi:hypothetical protein